MSKEYVFKIPGHIKTKVIHGETVIVNVDNGEYHIFNEIGGLIIRLISSGKNIREVSNYITGEYDVSNGIALAKIEEFIGLLEKKGLLVE